MPRRTSGLPQNGFPAGEGPWIRRSRLEHASSCTGAIRSRKDLPDSPSVEPVVYFLEIICFVRSWLTRTVTVLRRRTAGARSTSLKSVAEARETADRRSRRLSLNQPTRARGGASGPGSPVAMAAQATQAGGLTESDRRRHLATGHRIPDTGSSFGAADRAAHRCRLDLTAGTLEIDVMRVVVDGNVIESDGKTEMLSMCWPSIRSR
jgi:hypothetical protein